MLILLPSAIYHKPHNLFLLGNASLSRRQPGVVISFRPSAIVQPLIHNLKHSFLQFPHLSSTIVQGLVSLQTSSCRSRMSFHIPLTTWTWHLLQSMPLTYPQFLRSCIWIYSRGWWTQWTTVHPRCLVVMAGQSCTDATLSRSILSSTLPIIGQRYFYSSKWNTQFAGFKCSPTIDKIFRTLHTFMCCSFRAFK